MATIDNTAANTPTVPTARAITTCTITAKRAKLALALLLLASAPRNGRPFLFPSGTGSKTTGGNNGQLFFVGPAVDNAGLSLARSSRVRRVVNHRSRGLNGLRREEGAAGVGGGGQEARWLRRGIEIGFSTCATPSQGRRSRFGLDQVSSLSGRESSASRGSISPAWSAASTGIQEGSPAPQHPVDINDNGDDGDFERGDGEWVPTAGELLEEAREMFNDMIGEPDDVGEVSAGYAPGRVNLIGEHTDYNGGFVMPLALDRGTVVYGVGRLVDSDSLAGETSKEEEEEEDDERTDGRCRIISESIMLSDAEEDEGLGDVSFRADESLAPGDPEWANYVKGVVKGYMEKLPAGKSLEFAATVVATVPIEGGVSSSASLCVATATFLDGILANAGVSPPPTKEKAHLCRMAEHRFMNMPCGIMDQFVTSMAEPGHAMLLDCRSQDPAQVPLADDGLVIVVTNSNVKHKLAGSQYPVRVAQCEAARDAVKQLHAEVELLRDVSLQQVEEIEGRVEEAVFRRARHVVTENARTIATAEALRKRDYGTAGRYMLESHRSLREDYEVSCPELDALVELAMEVKGVFGSRMTGGGFGGCTVTLTDKDSVAALVEHLQEGYARTTGRECSCFVTQPGFGARGLAGAAAASTCEWPNT